MTNKHHFSFPGHVPFFFSVKTRDTNTFDTHYVDYSLVLFNANTHLYVCVYD